jgi:hypothetical protein
MLMHMVLEDKEDKGKVLVTVKMVLMEEMHF